MAERFKRLFTAEGHQFTAGAPLLIIAAALLQDSYGGSLLAQIKYRSVSQKSISSVTVSVTMLDAAGKSLGEPVQHKYQNLNIERDGEFGRNTAIVLPDGAARAFSVKVTEVVFADGSVWSSAGEWTPIKDLKTLEEDYGDAELANQYRVRYGSDCKYAPLSIGELWFCNCGAANYPSEAKCHLCRRSLKAQQSINLASLRTECAERVKLEQEQAELEAAELKAKKKKRGITALIMLPIIALIIAAALIVPKQLELNRSYQSAVALMNAHDFEGAKGAFIALGDYRDSAQQAEKNVPYMEAVYIMDSAAEEDASALTAAGISRSEAEQTPVLLLLYNAAIDRFTALDGYKDSAARIEMCKTSIADYIQAQSQALYDSAAALLESGSYLRARDAFLELEDFSNSSEMAQEAVYRKALALYDFIGKYDIRSISAVISTDADSPSLFYISTEAAMKLGSEVIADLNAACGQDAADVCLDKEPPADALPLSDALTKLFKGLGTYKDAAEYPDKIAYAIDYTREFFELCREGRLYAAYDWLTAYEEDFPNREHWMGLLDKYKPYCDSWVLNSGDSTVLPMTVGKTEACNSFDSAILLDGDSVTLRLNGTGVESFTVDLPVGENGTSFIYNDGIYTYYAAISVVDHIAYLKYDDSGNIRSSCEYERVK